AGKLARTRVGSIKGKVGYMSPEQVRGLPIDRRSDIFSVGICFWEFLTQQRLFHGDNDVVVMEQIRNADIQSPTSIVPGLSPHLDRMVMRSLAKNVDERYNSASDLCADLDAFAHTIGLVVQRDLVADYMRHTFPDGATTHRAASREEAHAMADKKGGSDLDVFEGLARKSPPRPTAPPQSSPPSGAPGSGAPPQPPGRARTLLGMAPSSRPTVATAPPGKMPSVPNLPPPPTSRSSGRLPAVSLPPARSSSPAVRAPMSSNPLPPPTNPPAKATSPGPVPAPSKLIPVEMDWDDEDEKTQVYDKASSDKIAQQAMQPLPAAGTPAPPPTSVGTAALLAGSGKVAAPMPKASPPAPPNSSVPAPNAQPSASPRSLASAAPTVLSAPKGNKGDSKFGMVLVALVALVAIVGGGWYLLRPKTGELKVYVSGPGDRDIGKVDIFINNKKVCTSSPCAIDKLKAGIHDVKAEADGYESTAPKGVEIKAGAQSKLDIKMAVASAGTGLKVTGQPGVNLVVDGNEMGPLPQTLKDLSPGEHKLQFKGDRFETLERTINVIPDQMEDLGDVKLKVTKGKATLELVTRGARILLVPSRGEKRQIDEHMFKNGQLSIDIDTSKKWRIEATKRGYENLEIPISFADGDAEKTFKIELREITRSNKPGPPKRMAASTGGNKPASTKNTTSTPTSPASGPSKLNINSIPPSAVLLDGRPLGRTPKAGIVVSPGTHTVTFIHPDKGRKSTSVTVKAGQTKGVGVRF
ncbi:MAG: hypothetical protein CSA75_00295, partial [Sorangium cellulosum]